MQIATPVDIGTTEFNSMFNLKLNWDVSHLG